MLSVAPDTIAFTRKPQGYGLPTSPIPASVLVPSERSHESHSFEASEKARLRQLAVAERLLLGALREHDAANRAVAAEGRAKFLASAGRDLARFRLPPWRTDTPCHPRRGCGVHSRPRRQWRRAPRPRW
jgi:hypothetical protein